MIDAGRIANIICASRKSPPPERRDSGIRSCAVDKLPTAFRPSPCPLYTRLASIRGRLLTDRASDVSKRTLTSVIVARAVGFPRLRQRRGHALDSFLFLYSRFGGCNRTWCRLAVPHSVRALTTWRASVVILTLVSHGRLY